MTKTRWFIERENKILKRLLKDGFFLINYDSTDCDGCSTSKAIKYTSLEELYKDEESAAEWSDGSVSFQLAPQYSDGSHDLNEPYNGGQWSTY